MPLDESVLHSFPEFSSGNDRLQCRPCRNSRDCILGPDLRSSLGFCKMLTRKYRTSQQKSSTQKADI
ncbi:hypothetical protein VTN31DRAFT_3301 [Thermomyces dupontii]|uniref:uncharacterized protein n=1 Tax=Talaromyces thermophilus TaxID=28565 RepID=UPI00374215DD